MDEAETPRCCFDDWVDGWSRRAAKGGTAARVTPRLLDALEEAGLAGRSVLDLGCGIGDLAIETVRRGAASATGFDLSARAIDAARRLAGERGVGDRTAFAVGDGARVPLSEVDVVVLNRTFCCYPDVESLLERSLAAARAVYAFTIPRSTGPAGAVARARTRLGNAWYRLRPSRFGGFRVFVHDIRRIDERVRAGGFEPVRRGHGGLGWDLAVYAR